MELDRDDAREGLPPPLPGPAWPLRLLADRNLAAPDPGRAAQVAQATADGDHAAHLTRWSRLVGADPVAAEDQGTPPGDGHSAFDDVSAAAERADVRAGLFGLTFSKIMRVYVHAWERRGRILNDEEDLDVGAMAERVELQLAEMTSVLRQLRASGTAGPFQAGPAGPAQPTIPTTPDDID